MKYRMKILLHLFGNEEVGEGSFSSKDKNKYRLKYFSYQPQVLVDSPAYHIAYNNLHYIIQPPQEHSGLSLASQFSFNCQDYSRYLPQRLHQSEHLPRYMKRMHQNYMKEINLNTRFTDAFKQKQNISSVSMPKKSSCNSSSENLCAQFTQSCEGRKPKNVSSKHFANQTEFTSSSEPCITPSKISSIDSNIRKHWALKNNSSLSSPLRFSNNCEAHLKNELILPTFMKTQTLKRTNSQCLSTIDSKDISKKQNSLLQNDCLYFDSKSRDSFGLKINKQFDIKTINKDGTSSQFSQLSCDNIDDKKPVLKNEESNSSQSVIQYTKSDQSTGNMKKINLDQYRARKNIKPKSSAINIDESGCSFRYDQSSTNKMKWSTNTEKLKTAGKSSELSVGENSLIAPQEKKCVNDSNLCSDQVLLSSSLSPPLSPVLGKTRSLKPSCSSSETVDLASTSSEYEKYNQSTQGHECEEKGLESLTSPKSYNKILKETNFPIQNSLITKEVFFGKRSPKSIADDSCVKLGSSVEEPVILTLSSDDDDDDDNKRNSNPAHGSSKEQKCSLEKAPASIGGCPMQSPGTAPPLKSFENRSEVSLRASVVWVGNYRVVPIDPVRLKRGSFTLVLPTVEKGGGLVSIILKSHGIVKLFVHLKEELPIFFLYLKESAGVYVRQLLKMTNSHSFYFDPISKNESQKRITIITEPIQIEDLFSIEDFFLSIADPRRGLIDLIEHISLEKASEILCKAEPPLESQTTSQASSWTTNSKTLLIYPPPPIKGGITITTDDYLCLEELQFLNDVIIDFYLKWLLFNKVGPEERERIHVFSTFFYKRLTSKPKRGQSNNVTEDNPDLTHAQKRHARVQSWTKSIDIFSKDFIFIPINKNKHWFLVVICFPGLESPVRISDGKEVSQLCITNFFQSKARVKVPLTTDLEGSDRDEADIDEDEIEESSNDGWANKPSLGYNKGTQQQPDTNVTETESCPSEGEIEDSSEGPIKQPCILIFDSLHVSSFLPVVATLREYLAIEHLKRKGVDRTFSKDTMKGCCPKVPKQRNFSDCGLFVLQFAQSFIEHPLKDFRVPLPNMEDWFSQDVVACKRKSIAKLIQSLMEQHRPAHGIVLPNLHFNSSPNTSPSRSPSPSESAITSPSLKDEHSRSSDCLLSFRCDDPEYTPAFHKTLKEPKQVKVDTVPVPRPKTPTPFNSEVQIFPSESEFDHPNDESNEMLNQLLGRECLSVFSKTNDFNRSPKHNSPFRPLKSKLSTEDTSMARKRWKALSATDGTSNERTRQDIFTKSDTMQEPISLLDEIFWANWNR